VAVAQSVEFACGLKVTEFVFCFIGDEQLLMLMLMFPEAKYEKGLTITSGTHLYFQLLQRA
jgi:hypothetical protein